MAFAGDMIDRRTVFPLASFTCIPHLVGVRLSWIATRTRDPLLSWGRLPESINDIYAAEKIIVNDNFFQYCTENLM